MMKSHILLTPPLVEPVSLDEMKSFLRLDGATEDDLLNGLIRAARHWCEQFTRRALINQTWCLWLSEVPTTNDIALPRCPLVSVTSIQTFDEKDQASIWNSSNYYADMVAQPGRICLRTDAAWPTLNRAANGLMIQYVAGYGATGDMVPEPIRLALKQLVAYWYEHRGESAAAMTLARAPLQIEALLQPYKVLSIGGA